MIPVLDARPQTASRLQQHRAVKHVSDSKCFDVKCDAISYVEVETVNSDSVASCVVSANISTIQCSSSSSSSIPNSIDSAACAQVTESGKAGSSIVVKNSESLDLDTKRLKCDSSSVPVISNITSQSSIPSVVTFVPNEAIAACSILVTKSPSTTPFILAVDTTGAVLHDAGEHCGKDSTTGTAAVTLGKTQCDDDLLSTALLDCGPGLNLRRYDRHSVSSISSDTRVDVGRHGDLNADSSDAAISHSIDKIWGRPALRRERSGYDSGGGVVRSSWSQENYFDDNDVTCIDIDLDDDDLASSVDVLHYRDTSATASDNSAHSWTEDDIDNDSCVYSGKLRSWAPLSGDVFDLLSSESELDISGDCESPMAYSAAFDAKCKKLPSLHPVGVGIAVTSDSDDVVQGFLSTSETSSGCDLSRSADGDVAAAAAAAASEATEPICAEQVLGGILATRPSARDVDRPSAARLAKRLFYLHGFRRADVSRHLTKRFAPWTWSAIFLSLQLLWYSTSILQNFPLFEKTASSD